jgi:hypothetical protein
MVKDDIKDRINKDQDYLDKKGSDGKTPYEYLDKL